MGLYHGPRFLGLTLTQDAATALAGSLSTMEPCLECFNVNRTRLLQYHDRLYNSINAVVSKSAPEHWDRAFALDVCMTDCHAGGPGLMW
jgi:hypothetical protein